MQFLCCQAHRIYLNTVIEVLNPRKERFRGCIIGGAIGDAWGSGFENQVEPLADIFHLFGKREEEVPRWAITDDTQLTLATIEAMTNDQELHPDTIVFHFLKYYKQKKLSGIGASTLKALRELEVGGHWSQVGRSGEYAAGNGAAMRIAPLAFQRNISRENIRNICFITHRNDEAYIGAYAIVVAIRAILEDSWNGERNLLKLVAKELPDTRVRDRLLNVATIDDLREVGKLGNSGYVVNSIPLALAAASRVKDIGMKSMFQTLIDIGGDTDTNCSIAGQVAGALLGIDGIPKSLIEKLSVLGDYGWIIEVVERFLESDR